MNCPGQYKKNKNGFSVIETVVVVAVFIIFLGVSEMAFFNFQFNNNLKIAGNNVVESLRHAKSNAQQVQGDSKWGVEILNNQITVFSGASYALRNTNLDQQIPLASGITASGLYEIVFEKVSGATLSPGTITLTSNYGTSNIVINAKGTITY